MSKGDVTFFILFKSPISSYEIDLSLVTLLTKCSQLLNSALNLTFLYSTALSALFRIYFLENFFLGSITITSPFAKFYILSFLTTVLQDSFGI
jgi:hypothetical protein